MIPRDFGEAIVSGVVDYQKEMERDSMNVNSGRSPVDEEGSGRAPYSNKIRIITGGQGYDDPSPTSHITPTGPNSPAPSSHSASAAS